MKFDFFKMQVNGNDYIFFDLLGKRNFEKKFESVQMLCDRNFGIGGDGVVLILPDANNDALMRIFNADGSEAKMCGSALSSVTLYLSEKLKKIKTKINTLSGEKIGFVFSDQSIKINMGVPTLLSAEQTELETFWGNLVQIGNHHFVTFMKELDSNIANNYGPKIENHPSFPDGINVEFVRIKNKKEIEMKIWERGSGATLSCGTGACAAVFAGIQKKKLANKVTVKMPGGNVKVEYNDSHIFLVTHPQTVFSGKIEL